MIEFASFAVFLSIFCFDDVIALINISLTKNSRLRPSPEKGVPGKIQGQKLNFLPCPSRVIILGKVTKFGGNRPKTKKVINRQTKFTWKTPPPSANRVKSGDFYFVAKLYEKSIKPLPRSRNQD